MKSRTLARDFIQTSEFQNEKQRGQRLIKALASLLYWTKLQTVLLLTGCVRRAGVNRTTIGKLDRSAVNRFGTIARHPTLYDDLCSDG